jgi:hypothetical protein
MRRPFELGCHGCHATPRNNRRRPLWAAANQVREQLVHAASTFRGAIKHVHGPGNVDCARDELVVLSLGRDAEAWVNSFVEHHLELGAKHIFFLDNASTDATVALLSRYDRVSVFTTELSFRKYEIGMRRWLTKTFGRNRWSLNCDADELFDYPYSERLALPEFLRYLNRYGYKAVTGQMLDMFSDRPFSALNGRSDDSLKQKYRFYDLSDLVETRDVYWIRNGDVQSPEIACIFGGIRKRFFGDDCLLLSKHPLVFADDTVGVYTYDSHFMTGAHVADISTVLLHYKYIGSLADRAKISVEQRWHKESGELYRGLADVLASDRDLCLRLETAQELNHVQELVDSKFLVVTDQYLQWVEEHGKMRAIWL